MSECTPDRPAEHDFPAPHVIREALDGKPRSEAIFWKAVLNLTVRLAKASARKYGIQPEDVEDIVQNTLLSVSKQRPEVLLGIRNWPGWLWTIVDRKALTFLERNKKHRATGSLDAGWESDDGAIAYLYDILSCPPQQRAAVMESEIDEYFRSLPKEKRDIFGLYLRGLKYREIAERIGGKTSNVGVVIHRVKLDIEAKFFTGCGGE